jgi:hypothetical protein
MLKLISFPMKRKLLSISFLFPTPNNYFLFFGCWVGQLAQAKDITKNISRNMAPPPMHEKGANYFFTWALLIHLANHHSSKCGR